MALSYSVVSMGALSRNRLWGEQEPRRPAHATTTLIRDGTTAILVDPGLAAPVLAQRLDERAGITFDEIDVVFLTTFLPVHRRALAAFTRSAWRMHGPAIDAVRAHLRGLEQRIGDEDAGERTRDDDRAEIATMIREESALLDRIEPAEEKIAPHVHLYPTAGVTCGAAGLLLAAATRTIIVAGDAVLTREYFEAGRVWERAVDVAEAQASFADILELADEIVPGHDNAFRAIGR